MYSSFWYKDFDAMAFKTMLRQLISKWGVMSIDLQTAFDSDAEFIPDGAGDYLQAGEIALPALDEPQGGTGPDIGTSPDLAAPAEEQVNLNDL